MCAIETTTKQNINKSFIIKVNNYKFTITFKTKTLINIKFLQDFYVLNNLVNFIKKKKNSSY